MSSRAEPSETVHSLTRIPTPALPRPPAAHRELPLLLVRQRPRHRVHHAQRAHGRAPRGPHNRPGVELEPQALHRRVVAEHLVGGGVLHLKDIVVLNDLARLHAEDGGLVLGGGAVGELLHVQAGGAREGVKVG